LALFSHALAFVAGFSAVFVTLGASVAFFGYALNQYLPAFVKIGGVILIVFGLQVTGVLDWLAERIRRAGATETLSGAATSRSSRAWAVMYTEGRVTGSHQPQMGLSLLIPDGGVLLGRLESLCRTGAGRDLPTG